MSRSRQTGAASTTTPLPSTRSTRRPLATTTPDRHQPLVWGGVFDTSPIPDDGARVRIVQGAVSLRPVNVTANNKTVEFAEDLGYSSASDSTVVPAGTYDFDVTQAGTAETLLTAPGVVLEANTTYELVIMGNPAMPTTRSELRPLADTTRQQPTPAP